MPRRNMEPIVSVTQVMNGLEMFMEVYENEHWPQEGVSSRELFKIFKLADFVEKCITRMHLDDTYDPMMIMFSDRYRSKWHREVDEEIFSEPLCDLVLEKIVGMTSNEVAIDRSIRSYLAVKDNPHLENVLKSLMMKEESARVIEKYSATIVFDQEKKVALHSKLFLGFVQKNMNKSDIIFKNIISKTSKEDSSMLFKCLTYTEQTHHDTVVLINKKLTDHLSLRDGSNTSMWSFVLCDMTERLLIEVCHRQEDIFKAIISFLEYAVGFARVSDTLWSFQKNSTIPETMTYRVVSEFFDRFTRTQDLLESMVQGIVNSNENLTFWIGVFKQSGVNTNQYIIREDFYSDDLFVE